MREENKKNGIENLASHRIHGVLPKKYHMKYRSGQEELVEEKSLKEIEQLIRQTSEDIDVPERLLPENMSRKLAFIRQKKKKRRRIILVILFILAVCAGLFAILSWKNRHLNKGQKDLQPIYSYDQLYKHYKGLTKKMDPYVCHSDRVLLGTYTNGTSVAFVSAGAEGTDCVSGDFTSANTREEGIGEGDYTVTDGNYIYTVYCETEGIENLDVDTGLSGYQLEVVIRQADGEKIPIVGKIQKIIQDNPYPDEWRKPSIYIYQNILVLAHSECVVQNGWEARACLDFYDVTDRSSPKLIKSVEQNGLYREFRVVDHILYLISMEPVIPVNGLKKELEEQYIPMVENKKLALQDIFMQEDSQGNAYSIISSWDLSEPGRCIDAKALVGYYQNVYITADNVYFSNMVYANPAEKEKTDCTQISKLSCKQGRMEAIAMAFFPGMLDNCFAIQEHGEELWVTAHVEHYIYRNGDEKDKNTTYENGVSESYTDVSVHTFDSQMRSLDSLEGLVREETIYAVRYIGQTGYFVSYKQTDPLVSIDFSDSRHLKVMDELVMPGFSQYLHPMQDNLLLGIGYDEGRGGKPFNEVKLDLYDVSNPRRLSRMEKKVLNHIMGCAVFTDYKWFMSDRKNKLFGVSVSDHKGNSHYLVYHYDREEGLQQVKNVKLGDADSEIWQGFRIGEYLYLVGRESEKKRVEVVKFNSN